MIHLTPTQERLVTVLIKQPMTAGQLSSTLAKSHGAVSCILSQLRNVGIVSMNRGVCECCKGKSPIYSITRNGKKLINEWWDR